MPGVKLDKQRLLRWKWKCSILLLGHQVNQENDKYLGHAWSKKDEGKIGQHTKLLPKEGMSHVAKVYISYLKPGKIILQGYDLYNWYSRRVSAMSV